MFQHPRYCYLPAMFQPGLPQVLGLCFSCGLSDSVLSVTSSFVELPSRQTPICPSIVCFTLIVLSCAVVLSFEVSSHTSVPCNHMNIIVYHRTATFKKSRKEVQMFWSTNQKLRKRRHTTSRLWVYSFVPWFHPCLHLSPSPNLFLSLWLLPFPCKPLRLTRYSPSSRVSLILSFVARCAFLLLMSLLLGFSISSLCSLSFLLPLFSSPYYRFSCSCSQRSFPLNLSFHTCETHETSHSTALRKNANKKKRQVFAAEPV